MFSANYAFRLLFGLILLSIFSLSLFTLSVQFSSLFMPFLKGLHRCRRCARFFFVVPSNSPTANIFRIVSRESLHLMMLLLIMQDVFKRFLSIFPHTYKYFGVYSTVVRLLFWKSHHINILWNPKKTASYYRFTVGFVMTARKSFGFWINPNFPCCCRFRNRTMHIHEHVCNLNVANNEKKKKTLGSNYEAIASAPGGNGRPTETLHCICIWKWSKIPPKDNYNILVVEL